MANDKKFIVKNGLQSQENVVIGSTTDNGTDKLQVTGSSKFTGKVDVTQSVAGTPTVKFTNSAGPDSLIAEFVGDSQSIQITNSTASDYSILNTGQDNGVRLYSDTDGVEILYNGVVDLDFNAAGIDFKREPSYNGDVFWNAGNDGSGSGLDADVLDGLDSTQFLRSDQSDTMNGSLIITGDLTVSGNTTTINTEEINLADNLITLNSNFTGAVPSENAGIEIERGSVEPNATFQWLEASDKWEMAGPSQGLVLGDASNRQGSITSYANSFIVEAGGASGVSNGTVYLSGKLNSTAAEAGVASFYNQGSGVSYGELRYNGSPKLRTEAAGIVTNGGARIQGTATIGTGTGGAYIYMDGAGGNGTIYSSAGEIGFLNSTFNYALKVDAAGDIQVTDDIYAQKFIDINDNAYEVVPSGISVLNNIDLEGALRHKGEIDTFINFPASDRVGFTLGNTQYGLMTNASFQYTGDVIADRFLDRNNNAFLLDPAGNSELNSANFYSGTANNSVNIGISATERFNIDVTDSQGYIRYIQDETNGTDHSVNFEIISTGIGLNRFNFNKNVNVGSNSITGGFGVFSDGAYASIYYDYEDESYFADFNNVGNSINMAGTIEGGNGTAALPTYTFGADPNTGMFRGAADRLNFSAGGNDEFQIYTTYTTSSGSSRAPIFYDSISTGYYGDFASTSVMNRIDIDDYIRHNGNTTTYLGFSANNIFKLFTNGVQRLNVDDNSADFSVNVYAPQFVDSDDNAYYGDFASTSVMNSININDYIRHNGNTTAYFGFSANNIFKLFTNNVERLNIDNDSADFAVDVYAPKYYTNDYLIHNGDTNTYIGFDAVDQFGVWTAGAKRFNVTAADSYFSTPLSVGDITATSRLQHGAIDPMLHVSQTDTTGAFNLVARFEAGGDADNTGGSILINMSNDRGMLIEGGRGVSDKAVGYLGLVNSAGANTRVISMAQDSTNYWVGINKATPSSPLSLAPNGTMGNNPIAAINRLMDFGDGGNVDFRFAGDSSGNAYLVTDNNFVIYDESASGKFAALSSGDVVVNGDSFINATPVVTTNFITSPAANKLHSSGGISIEGKDSLLSIYQADGANTAINEATFLGVNELGFSAGGGFYMDDTVTVKVRGNKDVFTTGNLYAGRYYDGNNNAYYADPASTSIMNRIDLDDYIRHNGDTNTYFGFSAADTFKIFTGGTQRLNIDNDSADFAVNVYAPKFIDSDANAYYLDPNSTSVLATIELDDYIQHKGNTDAYFGWAANNNYKLFTNGVERFNIDANSADFSVNVYAPRFYDTDDATYYVDPASTSIMNNVSFGQAASAGVKGRFLSIEGNADAGGEGSGRIFFAEHNATAASQDAYGMSLAYQGGSATINSVTGQPVTLNGTSNGTWALIGHDNSVNGLWAMRGPRDASYVEARVSFRAPIFYDSVNPAYYGDFASTSVTNIMRANQFQVDGSTYTIDSPSGDYGSIRVDGAKGGWAGYMISDDWGFMSNGTAEAGIFNDTRNEWSLLAADNGATTLYGNGIAQLSAENGYAAANNSFRSPIYYPPAGTTRFLDLDSANGSESLKIGGEIFREGFAADNGADNKFLTAQDENQFIWSTATNWGIAWATNTTSAYRHTQFGDNMISFVGAGNVRAAIDLDNGDAFFLGEVSAGNFALSAGGENISLNPQYGSGLADTTLFDGTAYWEKRNTTALQGNEANNIQTSEYAKNGDGPFASSYVVRTNQYRVFYSDMISVEPGEEIYGEQWVRVISGSGGSTYYGVEQYDKDKKPIAGNTGCVYFVAGGTITTSTSWQKFSSYHTIPTSHTPYLGSDGAGVKYIRIRVLMNHSTGGALREYGPPILKRVDVQSKLYTQESLYVGTDAVIVGDLTVDDITADIVDARNFRDRDNTAYFMNPLSGGKVAGTWDWTNGTINNLNNLTFNDPGPNEGIEWLGGSGWKIYESPDNLSTNAGGNLQIVQGTTSRARFNTSGDIIAGRYVDATRFRDADNVGYYADPASTSIFAALTLRTGGLQLERGYTNNAIWFNGGTDANHVLWNHYYGGPGARGAAGSGGFDGMYWNTYTGLRVRGGGAGAYDIARFNTDGPGSGNTHYVQLFANNVEQLGTRAGYAFAPTEMHSPIFKDSDNSAYYGDFASTSVVNIIRANQIQLDGATYIIDSAAGDYGSIKVSGQKNGWAGYSINDQWVFMSSGAANAGIFNDTDNEWSILAAQNSDVQIFYNGTWEERSRSGYMEARGSYRAPIFYDSNDTAFYADPNATSRFRGLTTLDVITSPGVTGYASSLVRRDNRIIAPSEDTAGELKFGFTSWANNNTAPWADYLHMRSYTDASGGSDNLVTFKKSGIGMRIWQQAWGSGTAYATYRNVTIYNENPGASNDLYASIYYDSNNTVYRADPDGTTNVKYLKSNTDGTSSYTRALTIKDAGQPELNFGSYPASWSSALQIQNNNNTDFIWISPLDDGYNARFRTAGTGLDFYTDGANDTGVYSGYIGNGSFRAPIFYDLDNTAYYVDPEGFSNMGSGLRATEIYARSWFRNDSSGTGLYNQATAMHWYSDSSSRFRLYSTSSTSQILFTTSGNNARGYVYADNSNNIGFLNQAGSWALRTNSGTTEVYGNLYAGVYYDRDNSGYYVDPNGTSVTNEMRANNFVHRGAVSDTSQFGLYTDSGKSTAYAIYKEGGAWTFPYPDLRIAFHTGIKFGANASYNGMRFYNDYNMAGQVMSINNGSDPLGGNNVYVNNNLQAGSSLRAPIFYDSNDTAYYFDGNATNSTRFRGVQAETMAYMGLSGQTRSSKEYYAARPRITGDTNYWTGNMGWGTIDMNTVADWGAGFIDSWSNPGNQPSGTSHWVGTQSFHYTNGSSRYGWQMVGGPIGNLRFRQSWGGFGAWRTIPMLNVNDGNVGTMYANSFVDSDNTGYYCDPTAFTNLNTGVRATDIYARSWFRNDGAGAGLYNQATGSHCYSYQGQYWAITGNNNSSSMSLQLRAAYNGTMCRWMYGDRTWSGDLNAAGQWQLQTRHEDGYSPTLRFIESSNESWTGNIGNDAGKLEYHANRFYIEAGGNSDRIVQFRRNGADRSYVDNNGLYVGTATSARWADLAERYTADDMYDNATVLGVNLDGDSEATLWQPGMPLLGVISTNPAVQMNDMGIEPGSTSKKARMNPFIALKGRIPCLVSQPVKKGQWVIPDANGKAKGVDYGTPGVNSYEIIGIALKDSENGEVEVKV